MPPFARLATLRAAVVTPDERGSNSAHADAMHLRVTAEFASRRYEVEHVTLWTNDQGDAYAASHDRNARYLSVRS